MSKHLFAAAFAVGLAIVAWVGAGFVGSSWLALAMTAVIAAVYLLGAFELTRFRAATGGLASALADIPQPLERLDAWFERVPQPLRQAVRLRLAGERAALPGPALTPYLVGLLVMLGMLGTFLGMVVTFKGAVFALEGSTDLQAIRSALAEPIRGLGLSFGTSVAGVAASAMLGLMSALSRRERVEASRALDQQVATVLLPFSLGHQRQETFRAVQEQARALPAVVGQLEALMERMERRSQQLDEQLLARQAQLQQEVVRAYGELAGSVGAALQDNLAAGARAAGDAIQPVVAGAMGQVVRETERLHARLGEVAQAQLEALSRQFGSLAEGVEARGTKVLAAVNDGLARSQADQAAFERSRTESEARWNAQQGERMDQLAALWRGELAALRQEESRRGDAAVARLGELQEAVTRHLATLGAALEAPLTRLLNTASEVPQAAAGVITQLRTEMSRLTERDNLALQERTALLEQLAALLQGVDRAAGEQRSAIEALVASASAMLERAGSGFAETLAAQAGQAADASAQAAGSAAELAGVAEAFGQGVQLFQASSDKLMETLQRIEASLTRSTARSDEQLAYYVAQAREVIDLSIASQQGLVENLRELRARPGKPVALVAGG